MASPVHPPPANRRSSIDVTDKPAIFNLAYIEARAYMSDQILPAYKKTSDFQVLLALVIAAASAIND
jgi:hypothetical protein